MKALVPLKVLAFFGSDLESVTGPDFLKKSHRDGYTLLALDSDAMAAAAGVGLDYTLMDDWLGPEQILRCIERAALCETGWYEQQLTFLSLVQRVCWFVVAFMAQTEPSFAARSVPIVVNQRRVVRAWPLIWLYVQEVGAAAEAFGIAANAARHRAMAMIVTTRDIWQSAVGWRSTGHGNLASPINARELLCIIY